MVARAAPLEVEKVLMAIDELHRWEARQKELAGGLNGARASAAEMARVRQQIVYYGGLLRDMKTRAHPDSVPRFIGRLGLGRGSK